MPKMRELNGSQAKRRRYPPNMNFGSLRLDSDTYPRKTAKTQKNRGAKVGDALGRRWGRAAPRPPA